MTQIIRNGIIYSRLIDSKTHSPFIDVIKCKICFNILLNPYDCSGCGNSFCFDCINNCIINHVPCPFKCEQYTINPSSFGITSYLSKLKFNCLNKQNGCKEVIPYASVIDHEKECKYFYTTCPNIKCKKTMKWTLIENHMRNECEYTLFKCPICDMEFLRSEHGAHVANCQNVRNSLQYTINDNKPKERSLDNDINNKDRYIDINTLLQSLPDLNEMSLASFIKILLYQINQSNKSLSDKFDALQDEILQMKEESDKACRNNMIFFENINNELETLNTKLEFIEINDTIKQSIAESIHNAMIKPAYNTDSIDDYSSNNNNNNNINNTLQLNSSTTISDALRMSNRRVRFGEYNKNQIKRSSALDQIKEVSSIEKMKNEKRGKRPNVVTNKNKKKANGYSPKKCPPNMLSNSMSTLNKSENYSHNYSNSLTGDNNNNTSSRFKPPIARPFNTFSNFTNSNLISIINNQEVILTKLDDLSDKMDNGNKKHTEKRLPFPELSMNTEDKKYQNNEEEEEEEDNNNSNNININSNDRHLNNKNEDDLMKNDQLNEEGNGSSSSINNNGNLNINNDLQMDYRNKNSIIYNIKKIIK